MKKFYKILTFIVLLLIIVIVSRFFYKKYYYDFLEYQTLRDKIVWTENEKLTWSDFKYNQEEKTIIIYGKVGLSIRYNVNDPILFRSKTTFIPSESIVSDTTELGNLRIVQAKFDLLEVYRRKMVKEVDSLRKLKSLELTPSDFDKMNGRYYDMFDNEWQQYIENKFDLESLKSIEKRIWTELNETTHNNVYN